jgi:hypothetical protein
VTSVAREIDRGPAAGAAARPVVNTHVHLPPNFSAFETVSAVIEAAATEGVAVVGSSNYHDFSVYREFGEAAERSGILALFGVEIITVLDELRVAGTLVNDPGNPGRTYLCGKAIARFDSPNSTAAALMATMRQASEARAAEMTVRLASLFAAAGLATGLTVATIAADVATRAAVPVQWVSLQERHVARAFQEAAFRGLPEAARGAFFERLYGATAVARPDDAAAVQEEIRARLMKAGRAAFVPEAAVSFEDAYRLILELGGIPCYPTLADGASPICEFEDPPDALAARLLARRIYAAELIPIRNRSEVVDRYVEAFRRAGIVVTAGTEHNTLRMLPLEPSCLDGEPISTASKEAFWEGACIAVAHQHLVANGERGYVDGDGSLNDSFLDGERRRRHFGRLGASLIESGSATRAAVAARRT